MGRSEVHSWLSSRGDFQAGVALWKQYEKDPIEPLQELFQTETGYSRQRLTEILQEFSTEAVADQQQEDAREPERVHDAVFSHVIVLRSPRNDGIDPAKLTPDLVLVHDQIKRNYAAMSHLHAQLEILPTDAARLQHALQIDTMDVFNVEGYIRIDAYLATGTDPAVAPPPSNDDLRKELLNHRSYVCKKDNQDKRPEEVERRRARIIEIEALLNAVHN